MAWAGDPARLVAHYRPLTSRLSVHRLAKLVLVSLVGIFVDLIADASEEHWRNRDTFITGQGEIVAFLTSKWERELDYALRKNLWCFDENRIAVRFQYECHDRDGQWWRSYGNELWEFDERGLMIRREASINDLRIDERDRRILGPRPESERNGELPVQ